MSQPSISSTSMIARASSVRSSTIPSTTTLSADCSQTPTRDRMLACLDDIELVARALLEKVLVGRGYLQLQDAVIASGSTNNSSAAAAAAGISASHEQLIQLLLKRDADLRALAEVASRQQVVHRHMEALREHVQHHERAIGQLQRSLKQAETRLASAVYQAGQKLESIKRAQQRPVKADELIRYAHRISSTDAVSAPLSWQQGDPRRPYPTEMEMRRGVLGRLAEVGSIPGGGGSALEATLRHVASHESAVVGPPAPPPPAPPQAVSGGGAGQFRWSYGAGEVRMTVAGGGSVAVASKHAQPHQDVEVMSTDSSSSSSSDSQ